MHHMTEGFATYLFDYINQLAGVVVSNSSVEASSHLVQLSLIGSSQHSVEGSDRAPWDQHCLYVLSDVVNSPWRALVLDLDVLLWHEGSSDSVDDQLQWQNKSDQGLGIFTSATC